MTPKQTNTLEAEIYNILYKNSTVDIVRVLHEDEWPITELLALFQKVVDKAIPQKEECYIDFNPKKHFIENLDNSNKIARNDLICKIRASFKDIVEGRETI